MTIGALPIRTTFAPDTPDCPLTYMWLEVHGFLANDGLCPQHI